MIEFDSVSFAYVGQRVPVLRDVNIAIPEGEFVLVVGHTGAGKSTLLKAINGLVPRFTGGTMSGHVRVGGHDTRDTPPRELATTVGVVGQDPMAGFVTDTVEEELAYTMEQLAIPPAVMRQRVEETLDVLGIAELRSRALRTLSGGQQQRVAIGSVLTAHPRVVVLDEPTSALDPTAAEDVLAAITRLVHDLGITVIVAEHRLERVVQFADQVMYVDGGGQILLGSPPEIFARIPVAPPIVELGKLAGWHPLPLSTRDARREAGPLRDRLTEDPPARFSPSVVADTSDKEAGMTAENITVRYGPLTAVNSVDFAVNTGEIVALMGRNGSGKSSLLWAIQGSGPRAGGCVRVDGADPAQMTRARARNLIGLVPQTPTDLIYHDSVRTECDAADQDAAVPRGTCAELLTRLVPGIDPEQHPRDLSEGQRLALVLAIQLTANPRVVALDEPTRGLDYLAKARLATQLFELAKTGHSIIVATHDVEFVAETAHRVTIMAEGEIVADGLVEELLPGSTAFAPQMARILAPRPYLTVAQVATAAEKARS